MLRTLRRLLRRASGAADRAVVLAVDPDSGFAAVYLDGALIHELEDDRALVVLGDALETLCLELGVDYDSQGRHQLGRKVEGPDWVEYEGYWPPRLADAPSDDRFYGPGELDAPPDDEEEPGVAAPRFVQVDPDRFHDFQLSITGVRVGCALCGRTDEHPCHDDRTWTVGRRFE